MKVLIITQKIDSDDDVLGFMHGWVNEFSKHCDKVTVICLQSGTYNFSNNVKVLSLGKEKISLFGKAKYIFNFYKYIWQEKDNYDCVFVHMNTEYILLAGLWWRLLRKKIGLWYAHGEVSARLIVANWLVDNIFTSTPSGCRIKSKKIKVLGQGIDTEKFKPDLNLVFEQDANIFKVVTVGRISPVKDYDTLIEAVAQLKKDKLDKKIRVDVIGGPGLKKQNKYFNSLKEKVIKKSLEENVFFIGSVPNDKIIIHLQLADLFVNMSFTGSLDKAILEAMACGLPVITCNEALDFILRDYKNKLLYTKKDSLDLAKKIEDIAKMDSDSRIALGKELRTIVVKNHSLDGLIKKIISFF